MRAGKGAGREKGGRKVGRKEWILWARCRCLGVRAGASLKKQPSVCVTKAEKPRGRKVAPLGQGRRERTGTGAEEREVLRQLDAGAPDGDL